MSCVQFTLLSLSIYIDTIKYIHFYNQIMADRLFFCYDYYFCFPSRPFSDLKRKNILNSFVHVFDQFCIFCFLMYTSVVFLFILILLCVELLMFYALFWFSWISFSLHRHVIATTRVLSVTTADPIIKPVVISNYTAFQCQT